MQTSCIICESAVSLQRMEKSRSWPSAHDWKSCIPQKGIEGSNPSFSAIENPGIHMNTGAFLLLFLPRKLGLLRIQLPGLSGHFRAGIGHICPCGNADTILGYQSGFFICPVRGSDVAPGKAFNSLCALLKRVHRDDHIPILINFIYPSFYLVIR